MKDIRELLQTRPLLFDGAMGTYYKAAPGVECEQANLTDPAGVLAVHREYLAAGADAVKTNTFSLPRLAAAHAPGWEQLAQAGWQLAVQAAEETGAAVFADLGPAPDTEAVPAGQVYTAVAKQFAALGARNFLFETLSSDAGLLNAVGPSRRKCRMPLCWCPLRSCPTATPGRACTAKTLPGGCRKVASWMPWA